MPLVKMIVTTLNALSQMQIDDEDEGGSQIPKDLHFKKNKVRSSLLLVLHDLDASQTSGATKSKKSNKKRKLDFDENTFINEGSVEIQWFCLIFVDFFSLAVKNRTEGPSANFIVEEAKHIASLPTGALESIPAIRKRLYQLMVEVAVVNEKIKSELAIRAQHVDDAADLTARLAELDPDSGHFSA